MASRQTTCSSSISSMETVESITATFLVGGRAGEQAGSGGALSKVVPWGQAAAMCPFFQHLRHHPSLKHISLSSGVSFFGFL